MCGIEVHHSNFMKITFNPDSLVEGKDLVLESELNMWLA